MKDYILIYGEPYEIEPHRFNPGDFIMFSNYIVYQIQPFTHTNHYSIKYITATREISPYKKNINVREITTVDSMSELLTQEEKASLL